jgi:hypothetical protein
MAARYVNPENIAAQGQSFYTGLHPVQYESGGGGGGGKNVMGAGSGGSAGVGADRSGADAGRAWNYPVMPSASIRNKNKGQEGPPKEEGGIPFGLPEPDLPPYGTPPGSPNGQGAPWTRTGGRPTLQLGAGEDFIDGESWEVEEPRGALSVGSSSRALGRERPMRELGTEHIKQEARDRRNAGRRDLTARRRGALAREESGETIPVSDAIWATTEVAKGAREGPTEFSEDAIVTALRRLSR